MRGAHVVGVSFGLTCVLALCAKNAHNALVKRHLSAPKFQTQPFQNYLVTVLAGIVGPRYFLALSQNLEGQWREGKTVAKLAKIDAAYLIGELWIQFVTAFIKLEGEAKKIPTKGRLIQANRNEFTAYTLPEEYCAVSQALKEELEFDLEGVRFKLQYAGGLNHDDLSDFFTEAWSRLAPNALIDERDGKNWDATMQEPLLRAEAAFYDALGMDVSKQFLKRSSGVKGRIFCKISRYVSVIVRYLSAWKRLSGDWNTSVGNTLISMLVVICNILALAPHLRPREVVALFMGDDYLGIYGYDKVPDPQELGAGLDRGDEAMGITPERSLFNDPLQCTFISLGVWPRRSGGYQFVPQPATQLVKLFTSAKPVPEQLIDDYVTGIAISFWPVYWGFHMMMDFLKAHYLKPSTKQTNPHYFAKMLTKKDRDVDWLKGFVYKYEIPYDATHFPMPRETGLYTHPVICHMLEYEARDPAQRAGALYIPTPG